MTATTISEQSAESTEASVIAGVTAKPSRPAKLATAKTATAKPAKTEKTEKTELSTSKKRLLVLNELIAAGAQLAAKWDPKTGVSKAEAIAILSNRLSYCGPKASYPRPLSVSKH